MKLNLAFFTVIVFGFVIYFIYLSFRDSYGHSRSDSNVKNKQDEKKITGEMIRKAEGNKIFGEFRLTDAVLLLDEYTIIPGDAYRIYSKVLENGTLSQKLVVSASAEKILDIFDEFIRLLGIECDLVIEDFQAHIDGHVDHFAYHRETFIIRSIFLDYEDFFLNDGMVAISIWSNATQFEVQLTTEKLIVVFANQLNSFEEVLFDCCIQEDSDFKFYTENKHLLKCIKSRDDYLETLKARICFDESIVQTKDRGNDSG